MRFEDYLKENKKTHLIFDFDETLFNLILPWNLCHKDVMQQLKKLDKSLVEGYFSGKINLSLFENSFVSKFPQTREIFIKSRIKFETEHLEDVVENKELVEFIRTHDCKYYIWSANTKEVIVSILKKAGIFEKFEKIITRDDLIMIKPDPEGFYKIYDNKTPLEAYLFVGNSKFDREAAEKVGIDFFLIDYFTDQETSY